MPGRVIQVQPPLGGIDRSLAYQRQPPFTTPYALNVRGRDVFERRDRLGSRPGLSKHYADQCWTEYREYVLGHCIPTSITDDASDTTINIAEHDFTFSSAHDGCWIYWSVTGNRYQIKTVASATSITVGGTTCHGEDQYHGNEIILVAGGTIAGSASDLAYVSSQVTFDTGGLVGTWVSGDPKFEIENRVKFSTTVSLPTGLTAGTTYLADELPPYTGNTFTLDVIWSGTGSGTHTGYNLLRTTVKFSGATSWDFTDDCVDMYLVFTASGNRYKILSVTSTTEIVVDGDATGESCTDTVTVKRYMHSLNTGPVVMVEKVNTLPDFTKLSQQLIKSDTENWMSYGAGTLPNNSSDNVWDKSTLTYRENYEYFNAEVDSGTYSTYTAYAGGKTTITISGWNTGGATTHWIEFTVSGNMYQFDSRVSTTSIKVAGDCRSETGTSPFRVWMPNTTLLPIRTGDPVFIATYVRSNWALGGTSPAVGYHWYVDASKTSIPSDLDSSKKYSISIDFSLSQYFSGDGETRAGAYITLGDGTHDDHIACGIGTRTSTDTIYLYHLGSLLNSKATTTRIGLSWHTLRLDIEGDQMGVYYDNNLLWTETLHAAHTLTNYGMFVFGNNGVLTTDYRGYCRQIQITYYSDTVLAPDFSTPEETIVVASSNGDIYAENEPESLDYIRTDCTLRDDVRIRGVEFDGSLYLADFGPIRIEGTDGILAYDAGTDIHRLTSAAVDALADYSGGWADGGLAIDPLNDVVVIWNVTGTCEDGIYRIISTADGYMEVSGIGMSAASVCSFRVLRGPKVYDPVHRVLDNWKATTDSEPTNSSNYGTVTFSSSTGLLATRNGHGLVDGDMVMFSAASGAVLPTGISEDTVYYVDQQDANTFKMSLSKTLSPLVSYSTAGSGTITQYVPRQLGAVPCGCPLIARFLGRIYLGGAASAPNVWYCSRVGVPLDYDFGANPDDPSRAIAGTATDFAVVADPLTTLAPWGDDYMILGTPESLWVMRGDPGSGGSIGNLSRSVGIINRGAWCWGPSGEFVFIGKGGVYVIAAGASSVPQLISGVIPEELTEIDTELYTALMQYDTSQHCVRIYLVDEKDTGAGENVSRSWIYDWKNAAFWQDSLAYIYCPLSLCAYSHSSSEESSVILGCRDGYLRKYNRGSSMDDLTSFTSDVLLGPFAIGGTAGYMEGILNEINTNLSANSSDVTWYVYVGNSVESAYKAYQDSQYFTTGTFSAGENYTVHPRSRGVAAFIRLTSIGRWALEDMNVSVFPGGKFRKM